jgi:predicted dehydrogenase
MPEGPTSAIDPGTPARPGGAAGASPQGDRAAGVASVPWAVAASAGPLPPARAPHPPELLRVGVVGCGRRAQAHLQTVAALQRAGYYDLVGVCDVDPARAQEAAARLGTRAFPAVADLLQALGARRPAAVVVVTPPEAHHPVVELAASCGVHCLCETPLSFSLACADRMVAAARRAGVHLEVAENVWRFPEERAKRLIVARGVLGEVGLLACRYTSGSYHGMNALRHLAGAAVTAVCGDAALLPSPRQGRAGGGETTAVAWEGALLRFATGARGVFQLPVRPGLHNHWEVDGSLGSLDGHSLCVGGAEATRIQPERVTERAGGVGPEVLVGIRYPAGPSNPEVFWENPLRGLPLPADADALARADEHLSLHRAATGAGPGDYPVERGREDLAAVLAIHECARAADGGGGRWLTLPLPAGLPHDLALHEEYARRFGFPPEEAAAHLEKTAFPPSYPLTR